MITLGSDHKLHNALRGRKFAYVLEHNGYAKEAFWRGEGLKISKMLLHNL